MLERGVIPPNALFDELNPEIDAEFYNLKVSISPSLLEVLLTTPIGTHGIHPLAQ